MRASLGFGGDLSGTELSGCLLLVVLVPRAQAVVEGSEAGCEAPPFRHSPSPARGWATSPSLRVRLGVGGCEVEDEEARLHGATGSSSALGSVGTTAAASSSSANAPVPPGCSSPAPAAGCLSFSSPAAGCLSFSSASFVRRRGLGRPRPRRACLLGWPRRARVLFPCALCLSLFLFSFCLL